MENVNEVRVQVSRSENRCKISDHGPDYKAAV